MFGGRKPLMASAGASPVAGSIELNYQKASPVLTSTPAVTSTKMPLLAVGFRRVL